MMVLYFSLDNVQYTIYCTSNPHTILPIVIKWSRIGKKKWGRMGELMGSGANQNKEKLDHNLPNPTPNRYHHMITS